MGFIEFTLEGGIEILVNIDNIASIEKLSKGVAIRTIASANGGAMSYLVYEKTYEQIKEEIKTLAKL